MDYAQAAGMQQAGAANGPRAQKPLESLALAAQRINTATVNIGHFLDRWHGPTPEPATSLSSLGAELEKPLPHGGNLDRLFSAIDRLESRIDALNAIG
jgi:hypothetical protein